MAVSEQVSGGGTGTEAGGPGKDSGGERAMPDDTAPLAAGDLIELTVPALATYLSVVRTATAGLAARLSFTFDEIEDLRIAVDEACVMVLSLPRSTPDDLATLTCRFRVQPDALAVTVSAPVDGDALMPAEQSFAWQVLIAHATDVTGAVNAGHASIGLRKLRH
jgi:serine/threonine-protein kinase RsbW